MKDWFKIHQGALALEEKEEGGRKVSLRKRKKLLIFPRVWQALKTTLNYN